MSLATKSQQPLVGFRTQANIAMEFSALTQRSHCPDGMYIIPSTDDPFTWSAVLFIHQDFYSGSILKFCLTFPTNYPNSPPEVQFTTDVFHPLISQQNGKLSLKGSQHRWIPSEHHVFHLLHWIKLAFNKTALDQITESDCNNPEAFRYQTSPSSFAALARQSSALSQSSSALYDADHPSVSTSTSAKTHDIVFTEMEDSEFKRAQQTMGLTPLDPSL